MRRILPLLLSLCLLTGCTVPPSSGTESGQAIYYLAPSGATPGDDALEISQERLSLPDGADTETLATAVVERLIAGPADGTLLSPFPKDTQLLSLSIVNGCAHVDLSGSFTRMEGIALTLADYCLTLSLTAIDGIDAVSITGGGKPLVQQPRELFCPRDVLLSPQEGARQQVAVTLYFSGENGDLVGEERLLELYEGDTQCAALLAALLAGPMADGLTAIIPKDFAASSVRAEDGICYLNFPARALEALPRDEAAQRLILRSITESLYSLDNIQELRFLSDGQELTHFSLIPVAEVNQRQEG